MARARRDATGPTALAQAYRLLRAILNVAVRDGVIEMNPCRLRSAGAPKPARPSRSLTVSEVQALAEAVPARYRVLILVLAFGGLRFGEATALRRRDLGVDGSTVRVERSVRYISGAWLVGPPKSEAGRRTVALPGSVRQRWLIILRGSSRARMTRWCSALPAATSLLGQTSVGRSTAP